MSIFRLLRPHTPAPEAPPAEHDSFEFAEHPDGTPAYFTPATDGHLSLTGGAGTGKTVLLRALAENASRVMDVYVADSWFCLNHDSAAGFSGTATECAAMLEAVRDEVIRRMTAGAGGTGAPEEAPRRVLVILDDARHLLSDDEYSPWGDLAAKDRSINCITAIATSAGKAGVSFVFSSQWPTAESAIPAGALRDESSRLVLGSDHGAGHALLEEISGGTDMYRPQKRQSLYEPLGGPSAVVLISSL